MLGSMTLATIPLASEEEDRDFLWFPVAESSDIWTPVTDEYDV